jgi:hypothetical protein
MAASALQVHHRVPRCLLGFFDRACEGELDGAGLQAWLDWEEEASRYGVDPDVSRPELVATIEASAKLVPDLEHRVCHTQAGDFARWGRRGGLETLARYGRPWFSLLGRRRWGKVGANLLARYLAERVEEKGGVTSGITPRFGLGQLFGTPAALSLLARAGIGPTTLLERHQRGDWGEVPPEDARENELSVREGFRILSSYPVGNDGVPV